MDGRDDNAQAFVPSAYSFISSQISLVSINQPTASIAGKVRHVVINTWIAVKRMARRRERRNKLREGNILPIRSCARDYLLDIIGWPPYSCFWTKLSENCSWRNILIVCYFEKCRRNLINSVDRTLKLFIVMSHKSLPTMSIFYMIIYSHMPSSIPMSLDSLGTDEELKMKPAFLCI
jgi:hypothetical protein